MRALSALILFLGACAPAAKPVPVVAPPKPSVAHARVSATAPVESDARASSKDPAVGRHALRARMTAAELFAEWVKAAPSLAVDAQVGTHAAGDALDFTITATTPDRALFACREVVAGLQAAEEHDRKDALIALYDERKQVIARLSDVAHLLNGFEIATNDFATARADLAKKLSSAQAATVDFPGALGAIVEGLADATKQRASLATSYGPNHPARLANEAEIAILSAQKEVQRKLEVDAAQAELDALDALPKNKRSPDDIAELRKKLLVARLSGKNVKASEGVDLEAPSRLRELALVHLRVRIERARDAISYGDSHPKMIASRERLVVIETTFAKELSAAVIDLQLKGAPKNDAGALKLELDRLMERLRQLVGWEEATVKQTPRLVVVSPCAG